MEMKDLIKLGNQLEEDDIDFIRAPYIPVMGRTNRPYPHNEIWTGEKRYRHLMIGAKQNRAGDELYTYLARSGRWVHVPSSTKASSYKNHPFHFKARILFRYYTINYHWKNNHARVLILEGKYKGKKISIRF